jgi:hypothetical protein
MPRGGGRSIPRAEATCPSLTAHKLLCCRARCQVDSSDWQRESRCFVHGQCRQHGSHEEPGGQDAVSDSHRRVQARIISCAYSKPLKTTSGQYLLHHSFKETRQQACMALRRVQQRSGTCRCMMHSFSLLIGSILGHEWSKELVANAQLLVCYFRAAHKPLGLLRKEASRLGIRASLARANATRFTSVHMCLESVHNLSGLS